MHKDPIKYLTLEEWLQAVLAKGATMKTGVRYIDWPSLTDEIQLDWDEEHTSVAIR